MYRRAKIALCVLVVSCSASSAATFAPKVDDVCVPLDAHSSKLVVDRDALLAQLIQTAHGINTHMMGVPARGEVYAREVDILLNPLDLCLPSQLVNGACKAADGKKLGEAIIELANFLDLHRKPPADLSNGWIDSSKLAVSPADDQHFSQATIERYLRASIDPHLLTCTKATQNAGGGAGGPGGAGGQGGGNAGGSSAGSGSAPDPTAPFIALRQTIDDLKYSGTLPADAQGFKGAKAANLAGSNDRILDKYSVTVDAALGYVFPRRSFDDAGNFIGQFAPFITYDQQFIQTNSPKTSSYVQNLGAGVTGDVTMFERHNIAVTPKYVESLRNDARVFEGNFAYTPMYGIPGVDSLLYVVPGTLSFLVTPQLKYIIRDVTAAGTNLTVLNPGDYSWYGGRINLAMFGEGVLNGFTYNVGYEEYAANEGGLRRVDNFLTSIGYTFGDAKLVSILFQYQRGRNLDTLDSVNLFTLGLGLKY